MSLPVFAFESFQSKHTACLAIGNFDGVHYAHQKVLEEMIEWSRTNGWQSYVLTFEPHPRKVLNSSADFHLLQSYSQKYETLIKTGIDGIIVANFTKEFSAVSPVSFLDTLCSKIPLASVYIGFNFRFGKGALGTPCAMKSYLEPKKITCQIADPIEYEGIKVSSAFLRKELTTGRIESYLRYTGRYYTVEETVVKGSDRGKKIGYATANLQSVTALLKHGVYIAKTTLIDSSEKESLVHVGPNPTFGETLIKMEVHIPDFDGNLYGQPLKVEFMNYLRDIQIFANPEALQFQIRDDIRLMRAFFKSF